MPNKTPAHILYVIIISQFCCTSLWFAVNAILPQLQQDYLWPAEAIGYTTATIQIGFIIGTLTYAVSGISDRFSPSLVFFGSSLLAAVANLLCLIDLSSIELSLVSRLFTGFFLAGVYPVGMKIASDWQQGGLGHWLGALVGALVLGTAFPHALKYFPAFLDPLQLIKTVSILCAIGGVAMWVFVKDGPFHKQSPQFSFAEVRGAFQNKNFRSAAFGYFGHMWELYAFWAFVPVVLTYYQSITNENFSLPLWSFIIIAAGFIGCIAGGKLSVRYGSKIIAAVALAGSTICCLISPLVFSFSFPLFMGFLFFWGFMAVADSPQFSALVALHAPSAVRGSAITITTCIGFAITVVSIQLINILQNLLPVPYLLLILSLGPLLGLVWLLQLKLFKWEK